MYEESQSNLAKNNSPILKGGNISYVKVITMLKKTCMLEDTPHRWSKIEEVIRFGRQGYEVLTHQTRLGTCTVHIASLFLMPFYWLINRIHLPSNLDARFRRKNNIRTIIIRSESSVDSKAPITAGARGRLLLKVSQQIFHGLRRNTAKGPMRV